MKKFTIISTCLLFCVLVSYGQWYWEEANLSMAKAQMGVASMGSKVFFAGGWTWATGAIETIETYDVETGLKTTDDVLSAARILPVGKTCGTRVFFAGGGIFPTTFFKQVDIYYSRMDLWDYDNLSEKRFALSAVSHGSKVLFAGGFKDGFVPSSRVNIYDAEINTWDTAHLSAPRCSENVFVSIGRYAFYVGGGSFNGTSYDNCTDVVDVYDSYTNTWSVIYLPAPLVWHSVTTAGNKLVVAGGQTFDGANWIYQDLILILDVVDGIDLQVKENLLFRVYPNPVSQSTIFSYTLKESGYVRIQVFNNFGQLVDEPLNNYQTKGEHQMTWVAGNLPAGIYFYCIQAGNEVGGGKIIKW